jgi:hypothetical protein
MACASDRALIAQVEVHPAMFVLTKGPKADMESLSLDRAINLKGRELRKL